MERKAIAKVWDLDWQAAPVFDPATNLLSGAAVMDALRRELARAARFCPDVAAVALGVGLSGLTPAANEELLRRAGSVGKRCVRDYDPVGRIGPADLLFVFSDCRLFEGQRIATRLTTQIRSRLGLGQVWAGVSATGSGHSDPERLVREAMSAVRAARLSHAAASTVPKPWMGAPTGEQRVLAS